MHQPSSWGKNPIQLCSSIVLEVCPYVHRVWLFGYPILLGSPSATPFCFPASRLASSPASTWCWGIGLYRRCALHQREALVVMWFGVSVAAQFHWCLDSIQVEDVRVPRSPSSPSVRSSSSWSSSPRGSTGMCARGSWQSESLKISVKVRAVYKLIWKNFIETLISIRTNL